MLYYVELIPISSAVSGVCIALAWRRVAPAILLSLVGCAIFAVLWLTGMLIEDPLWIFFLCIVAWHAAHCWIARRERKIVITAPAPTSS
ncbi:MAG: hypothetical protein AAGD00_05675 [Planctomycetota bacterium]